MTRRLPVFPHKPQGEAMPMKLGCPNCQSVMKVSTKVPRGTPIKCPSCSLVFPNPGKNGRWRSSDHHSSSSSHSTRPARSSFGLKIKRILIVFLFLVVVGVGGTGAYFLGAKFAFGGLGRTDSQAKGPGTQPGGPTGSTATNENPINKGSGKEDPLAFVPADANVLIGMSGPGMLAQPQLKTILEQNLSQLGLVKTIVDCKKETGLELKDLFDTAIIALKMPLSADKPESITLVVKSSAAFDQTKLGQWASDKPVQKLKDKFYYDKHKDISSAVTVYMPSDRLLVISDIPASKWDALLTTDGSKPAAAADTVALVRKAEKGPFWIVLPFDAKAKEDLKAGKGRPVELAALLPAGMQPAYKKAVADAKAAAFSALPE